MSPLWGKSSGGIHRQWGRLRRAPRGLAGARDRSAVFRNLRSGVAVAAVMTAAAGLTTLSGLTATAGTVQASHVGTHRTTCHGRHHAGCATPQGILFDDFDYAGPSDPAVARHGWEVRTSSGGPGVEGATW